VLPPRSNRLVNFNSSLTAQLFPDQFEDRQAKLSQMYSGRVIVDLYIDITSIDTNTTATFTSTTAIKLIAKV